MALQPQLLDPTWTALEAAADYLGNGAIEIPEFQPEILDLVRRRGVLGQRIRYTMATGHPTRYFEQTAIATGAFTDPRNISASATGPTRVENAVSLRAVVGQINFGLFDVELTRQQGIYDDLVAKDLEDLIKGTYQTEDKALHNGSNAATPTQFDGVLTAVTQTSTIASGASIIDGIRTEVATMVANTTYEVRPTAIYLNPLLLNQIELEAKNSSNVIKVMEDKGYEVVPGVQVQQIITAAGLLPVIPAWELGQATGGGGPTNTTYYAEIVTEDMLEYHYLTSETPRVFQLGLVGDLATKYVVVKFGTLVVKGPSYAHSVVSVYR